MKQIPTWAIVLLAGAAGGLMAIAGIGAGMLGFLLLLAAPMSIYITALGWGPVAGFVAAGIATAISSYDGSISSVVSTGTLLFLPAAWAGHLANLARPAPDGHGMVWYPLSSILVRLMLALVAGFILTGWMSGLSAARFATVLTELMRALVERNPELQPANEADIARAAMLYAALLPLVMPTLWLLLHVLVFHGAAAITRQSGRLARPADDIAATAGLPIEALVIPVAGIAAMFALPSPGYDIGALLTGIGIAGFGLIGLAELHLVTRGRQGRGLLLFVTYLLLILFTVMPLAFLAVWGAIRVLRRRPTPPPRPPARQGPGNTD